MREPGSFFRKAEPGGEVLIVGGGIIGCGAAYQLAKRGVSVRVLEKNDIASGASSRNGGGVRQSARDPRELPLAMHAVRRHWPTLAEELGSDVEYVQGGNLRLAKTSQHLEHLKGLVENGCAAGLDLEMIDAAQVRTICPAVSEDVVGASWCPTDGHANPMRATLAYYKQARRLGVRFETGVEVRKLLMRRGAVQGVETSHGRREAQLVINAAGVGSRALARDVGLDIPMQPRNVEVLVTDRQAPAFQQMIGTAASDFYGHQTAHGSFVFGGMTGLEPFGSPRRTHETESGTASAVSRAVLGYFPGLAKANVVRSWAGELAITADGVPLIGPVDELPGFFFASAFCGHGFGIAPAVVELIAQMLCGETTSIDPSAFAWDRFRPRT